MSPPRPGSSSLPLPDWLERGLPHVWRPYTQMQTAPPPLPVVRADGVWLELADGRRLLDGIASWWTAAHGYNHPRIRDAMQRQLARFPHVMLGGLAHEQPYRLATRLAALLPGALNHVFFSESGSLSVEIAMKIAVQYWLHRGERRSRFVSFLGGYHGDSFAAMSVCDPQEGMHALFRDVLPAQHVVPLPGDDAALGRLESLLAERAGDIAAVLVEPLVQGAGGMRFHEPATLRRLRALCDRHGLLLIFDEIFVGFGRLGRSLFACEQAGVTPDILTLSKALTGGAAPLAATVASEQVFSAFLDPRPARALMHGPTYTGHALGCAAANASLDLFEEEPRLAQAEAIGRALEASLAAARSLPGVRDVRVRGALGVIELDALHDADWLRERFLAREVWLRPFGNILYTTPALVMEDREVRRLGTAMVEVAEEWSRRFHGQ